MIVNVNEISGVSDVPDDVDEGTNLNLPTIPATSNELGPAAPLVKDDVEEPITRQKESRQCIRYPIDKYVSFVKLDHKLKCFISSLEYFFIPKCVVDVQSYPKWNEAMKEEIAALVKNGIWEIVNILENSHLIRCK